MTVITNENRAEWYGYAVVSPDEPVVAGTTGTWQVKYTAGKYGVDDGGTIKVSYKMASDWGTPQMVDPAAFEYLTVRTSGKAKLRIRYETRAYLRPYFRTIQIDVYDGSLIAGDEVVVTFGDTSGGSKGSVAQTFIDDDFRFIVSIEAFQTGVFYEVPAKTRLCIVAAAPEKLIAIAPSRVDAGEGWVMVKAQDRFGNLAGGYRGTVEFLPQPGLSGLPAKYTYTEEDGGSHFFYGIRFDKPGIVRLGVADGAGLTAFTNPVDVSARATRDGVFWGDFHGQTKNSVGTGTVEQYFAFGRDRSALDFSAHNANDFQVLKEHWDDVKEMSKRFNEPGRFITFLGSEWSGSTPAGGDHNVYYLGDEAPLHRSSHWQVPDKSDEALDCYPVDELYRAVKKDGLTAMIVPHVGGRYANLDYHDPELEPVVEVCSAHGRFEWIMQDAIARGYKVGAVADSDDHTGRPGASYPTKGHFHVRGGLTAVFAKGKTREAIWDAIKARRCYATSGERILLDFRMNGRMMGEEVFCKSEPLDFTVRVNGSAGIYRCEIKRGLETVYTYSPATKRNPARIRIAWGGARLRSRDRHSRWTGGLSLTGGKIVGATGFAFDAPWKGIQRWDESSVRWQSTTAGDIDGVMLEVDAPDSAVLSFDTPTAAFSITLGEIRKKDLRHDAGLLNQHVEIGTAPEGCNPADVEFSYREAAPRPGTTPYYVVVMQDDGEMAWSSPVFITSVS
jgi:hypothetical protein